MAKNLIILISIIFIGNRVNAQSQQTGIYLTLEDFESKKLTYNTNADEAKTTIRFNELLDKPYINVKHNGEKLVLFKDDIFAYQKKGRIVKSRDFESYNFVEKGAIWIYFKDITTLLGKGIKRERKYFYSVSGDSRIMPLTIFNLKKSFPGKHDFHNFLDAQFRHDADLIAYNKLEKKFKVNHLIETTVFKTPDVAP
jgi:hypothetical protein